MLIEWRVIPFANTKYTLIVYFWHKNSRVKNPSWKNCWTVSWRSTRFPTPKYTFSIMMQILYILISVLFIVLLLLYYEYCIIFNYTNTYTNEISEIVNMINIITQISYGVAWWCPCKCYIFCFQPIVSYKLKVMIQ